MATWKKVVVSGSSAELAALKVDNLTSGQVVIGGGQVGNLTSTAINGTGNILATTAATGVSISGSFSGSFFGDGSGLSGVSADFPSTQKTDLASTDKFFINDGISKYVTYSDILTDLAGTNLAVEGSDSLTLATTITGITSISSTSFTGSLQGTASQAVTSSFATTAAKVNNALTLGDGLTGNAFDGSTAITAAVGAGALITVNADSVMLTTSSLSTNQIPKYSANALAGSNISDTGTQVQIAAGASSGFSVAAGGVNVTGNSTFNNNLVVSGDLTVAGTASFQNTQNLLVADQFILLASGSNTLVDGGIIVANGGLSGSALYLEVASTGTYGRWAVASELNASASSATADEYMVSAKINQASNPSAAPTWGNTTNGSGNLWVTNAGDIFIYA